MTNIGITATIRPAAASAIVARLAAVSISVAALAAVSIITAGPALAATPGPDCTVREVIEVQTHNLDPRYLGTLGDGGKARAVATVRRQSVWKTPAATRPPTAAATGS